MCWTSISKKKPQIQKAESDIKVNKFLLLDDEGKFLAPYFIQEYMLGKVVEADAPLVIKLLDEENGSCYSWYATEGIHSYSPDCIVRQDKSLIKIHPNDGDTSLVLDYWMDAYGIPGAAIWDYPGAVCIMSARIPKGADYCKNEYGEYISSHLVVDKMVCRLEDLLSSGQMKEQMALNEILD